MNARLDVGSTLREVFATYRAHAALLLPVAFSVFLIAAIVAELVGDDPPLMLITVAVNLGSAALYEGIVIGLVQRVHDNRLDLSVRDLIASTMPFVLPLAAVGMLITVAVAIAFLAVILPALILLTIWAVVAPAIVVERMGVMKSLGRSDELVHGQGWPVFRVVAVGFLIVVVGGLGLNGLAIDIADGTPTGVLLSTLIWTVTIPIYPLVSSVLYFRLRAIEDSATPVPTQVPIQPA